MTVAGTAVQWRGEKAAVTLDLATAEGVLARPDGAREIVSADGYRIRVELTLWRSGAKLVERLDALTPPGRLLLQPARDASDIPTVTPTLRDRIPRRR